MSLVVTGSIGIDTVKTPHGMRRDCLGGAAVYFSMAASFFGPVRFVGVIGADCPFDLGEVFAGRPVDLAGLEVRAQSKTFRWHGSYAENMNDRKTDYVELNVLAEAPPKVPAAFKNSKYVFLANTVPNLQLELLDQITKPTFVAADTMDCWIENDIDDLMKLLQKIDCLILNDDEAKQLAEESNLVKAADRILAMGVDTVVIKKGEAGSITCDSQGRRLLLPAYPATNVMDPTGAGDSFAGGMLGYLAGHDQVEFGALKTAVAYGTVVASFTIADFSLAGLTSVDRKAIDGRLAELRDLTSF